MLEKEYLADRVQDQINWYDAKSAWHKKAFMRLKVAEIILALLVPFLTGYITSVTDALKITVGIIGVLVAAIAGITTLYKLQENWIAYRAVAESLKYEKYLYLTKAGPYKDPNAFPAFVERIEGLIAKENAKWATNYEGVKQPATTEATNITAPASPQFSNNGDTDVLEPEPILQP